MTPGSQPLTIVVTGSCFSGTSVVRANGTPLATTMIDASTLSCELVPQVPQALIPGGICMNVSEPGVPVSNSVALVVGTGNNAGTFRREPFDPSPGDLYSIIMEGGAPFAPFTLLADFGVGSPVPGFPDPISNLVLAVSPFVGSAGPFVVVFDGMGIFGPPSGIAYDGSGSFVIPFIPLPNPPFGVAITLQAVYVDPTSPLGFRLTWARFPEQL
jgi:hypothetical protein